MSEQEYKLIGSEIVRTKDEKIVANVEDGKVTPTAPAYFKEAIFDKIKAAAGINEPAPEVDLDEEEPSEVQVFANEIEDIFKEGGFLGVAEVMLNREKAIQEKIEAMKPKREVSESSSAVIDFSDAPKCNPSQGDRTPEFMAWLRKNHPEEAIKRYGE